MLFAASCFALQVHCPHTCQFVSLDLVSMQDISNPSDSYIHANKLRESVRRKKRHSAARFGSGWLAHGWKIEGAGP